MNNVEARVNALENLLFGLPFAAVESRLAALEQGQWANPTGAGGATTSGANLIPAMTGAGGINASSGGVSGAATVTLYDVDPSTGAESVYTTATAFNFFTVAVGANKRIYVAQTVNSSGQTIYFVPTEQCP